MPNINLYSPQTGRRIKEDNSIVNTADMIEAIYNALVVNKNAGMQLSGSKLSDVVTMQNAATANGNGTVLATSGMSTAILAISGTFVATINFEGQGPDGNWYAVNALGKNTGSFATRASSPGLYEIDVSGLSAVRARISGYSSGSVTVKGQAQAATSGDKFVRNTGTISKLEKLMSARTVTAGSAYNLSSYDDMSDCDFFRILHWEVNNQQNFKYRILVVPKIDGVGWPIGFAVELLSYDGTNMVGRDDQAKFTYTTPHRTWTKLYQPICDRFGLRYENQDTVDVTVDVYMMKMARRGV